MLGLSLGLYIIPIPCAGVTFYCSLFKKNIIVWNCSTLCNACASTTQKQSLLTFLLIYVLTYLGLLSNLLIYYSLTYLLTHSLAYLISYFSSRARFASFPFTVTHEFTWSPPPPSSHVLVRTNSIFFSHLLSPVDLPTRRSRLNHSHVF